MKTLFLRLQKATGLSFVLAYPGHAKVEPFAGQSTLGTRGFLSRAAGSFGGRRPTHLWTNAEVSSGEDFRADHYKDLTEAGKPRIKGL